MALTPCQFRVWRFLQRSGCRVCQWSVRAIKRALDPISRSTVEIALKVLNALGIIRTRPGTYNRASEHEILQTVTISTDAPAPEFRDASVPESRDTKEGTGQNRDTPPGKSGHSPANFCSACGLRLGEDSRGGSRASVIDDETRARLTTDRLQEPDNNPVSQSVVFDWLAKRCGPIGPDLRRRLEAAIERTGDPAEWIVRFFEYKWPDVQERYRRGALNYVSAGLFHRALWEGEMHAWKNLHAEELARELRWKERAQEDDARKGMGVEESASGFEDPVAEVERRKAAGAGAFA